VILVCVFFCSQGTAGPYAPAAWQPGSTAIYMDDPNFVGWAADAVIERGYIDISDPSLGYASYGSAEDALGKAEGQASYGVVSLGDGGVATLGFEHPIANGPGDDFAVFENGFSDDFLELGFVEVSSDGSNFFRFKAVSLTQTDTQVGGFGTLDATELYNFAGKYRQGYGVGFDLAELKGISPLLDVSGITHVRIIDVVGCIGVSYRSYDSRGRKVNDPWPTPFTVGTGGFDLDAVGVIYEKTLLADFNGDGIVNCSDYSIFAAAYLSRQSDENFNDKCDIHYPTDNVVDIRDFGWFVDRWLNTEQWYNQ